MPATTRRASGAASRTASRMSLRLASVAAGSVPRRPSLAPSASTNTSGVFWRSAQAMRPLPPAEVSPLTPALTTSTATPDWRIWSPTKAG